MLLRLRGFWELSWGGGGGGGRGWWGGGGEFGVRFCNVSRVTFWSCRSNMFIVSKQFFPANVYSRLPLLCRCRTNDSNLILYSIQSIVIHGLYMYVGTNSVE